MLFFMLAAFLPLVLACDVFLLGTATVDTSLYVQILLISVLILSHRYIIFTDFGLVNGFIRIFSSFQKNFFIKVFNKSVDLHFLLCYLICVANIGVWLSLVERFVRDEEVACSNHVTPTIKPLVSAVFLFFDHYRRMSVIAVRNNFPCCHQIIDI